VLGLCPLYSRKRTAAGLGLSGLFSVPNRFFDWVLASYYVTDNFKLSIGHLYTFGHNRLTLGSEYGFALGGGRMASLFVAALFAEGGNNAVLGGVRFYFGQRDKPLIDHHRQDDPEEDLFGNGGAGGVGTAVANRGSNDVGFAAPCNFHHPC
jgi:hypothetical protein